LSRGVKLDNEGAQVIANLQVEPQWEDRDDIETHLQMPADLKQLVTCIAGAK